MDVIITFFAAMASVFFAVCMLISTCIWCVTARNSKHRSLPGCLWCGKDPEELCILPGKLNSPRIVSGPEELVVSYSAGSASKTATVFHFPSVARPLCEEAQHLLAADVGCEQSDVPKNEEEPKQVVEAVPICSVNRRHVDKLMNRKLLRSVRDKMWCFPLNCMHHSQSLPSLLRAQGGSLSGDLDEGSSFEDMCSRFNSSVLSFSRENSTCTERSLSVVSGDEFLSMLQSPGSRSSLWRSVTSETETPTSGSPGSSHTFFSVRSTGTLAPENDTSSNSSSATTPADTNCDGQHSSSSVICQPVKTDAHLC